MTIFNRMGRLLKADMNGILDHIEEPEIMLKQAVRDMEAEIAREEAERKQLQAEAKNYERKAEQLQKKILEAEHSVEESLKHEKEDMARAFVKRKLEFERLQKVTKQRQEKGVLQEQEITQRLIERKDQLSIVKQKMEVFLIEKKTISDLEVNCQSGMDSDLLVTEDDIEIAMLQYRKRSPELATKQKGGK